MLTVAGGTIRSILYPGLNRLPVHALGENFCDLGMAFAAGRGDIPMTYLGRRILRRQNPMAAVAVRTYCRFFPLHHRAPVGALQILLDRPQQRDLVTGQESRVCVAPGAGSRLILSRD